MLIATEEEEVGMTEAAAEEEGLGMIVQGLIAEEGEETGGDGEPGGGSEPGGEGSEPGGWGSQDEGGLGEDPAIEAEEQLSEEEEDESSAEEDQIEEEETITEAEAEEKQMSDEEMEDQEVADYEQGTDELDPLLNECKERDGDSLSQLANLDAMRYADALSGRVSDEVLSAELSFGIASGMLNACYERYRQGAMEILDERRGLGLPMRQDGRVDLLPRDDSPDWPEPPRFPPRSPRPWAQPR